MKPRSEEMDEAIRQALSRLPDAPPPGSSFDSGQLWNRMHHQLPTASRRWRIGLAGWAAAMTLLMAGWLGWVWLSDTNTPLARKPVVAQASSGRQAPVAEKTAPAEASRPMRQPQDTPGGRMTSQDVAKLQAVETDRPLPEQVAISEQPALARLLSPTIANTASDTARPILSAAAPKRRFRVMHVNELPTPMPDPIIYRTEGFVRLGSGMSHPPDAERSVQPLRVPLTATNN